MGWANTLPLIGCTPGDAGVWAEVEQALKQFEGPDGFVGPCELLVDGGDTAHAVELAELAARESWRIEQRFSRYRTDSVVAAIHAAHGRPVVVDDETADLLDYAAECHAISDGRFDITSGVLRHAWTFDGGSRVPEPEALRALLARVGWPRVGWRRPELMLPDGMELDFGGIGKEYAVDRVAAVVEARARHPFLVNFGGDLYTPGQRAGGRVGLSIHLHPRHQSRR